MNAPRKRWRHRLHRLGRYGVVGVTAAAIHFGVLRGLGLVLADWLANPIAFLAASIAGYLGHALLTFREETGGQRFPRRWLLLQYAVNLSVCGVLPLLLPVSSIDRVHRLHARVEGRQLPEHVVDLIEPRVVSGHMRQDELLVVLSDVRATKEVPCQGSVVEA